MSCFNRFDNIGKEAAARVEDIANSIRLNEFLKKKELEDKQKRAIIMVLAIIGTVAAVAAIAYAVYRFFAPDRLEDYEDDYDDDDFDDDFFDDEDEEEEKK